MAEVCLNVEAANKGVEPQAIRRKTRKKFNAGKALARLGPEITMTLKQDVAIVTLNISGLRSP